MRVNGNDIALRKKRALAERVHRMNEHPTLAIFTGSEDAVSTRFVTRKQEEAREVGITTRIIGFQSGISERRLKKEIAVRGKDGTCHGIVVQLPLPEEMDVQEVLNTIPAAKDADVLSEEAFTAFCRGTFPVFPPVVRAIDSVISEHQISLNGKHVVVMGKGRLVGMPIITWLEREGITPTIIDSQTPDAAHVIQDADVLISGVGKPWMVKPEMLKPGVVLIDAGTATAEGKLRGDIDPRCEDIASLFTPVPGGIGPITVVALLENVVTLWEHMH